MFNLDCSFGLSNSEINPGHVGTFTYNQRSEVRFDPSSTYVMLFCSIRDAIEFLRDNLHITVSEAVALFNQHCRDWEDEMGHAFALPVTYN